MIMTDLETRLNALYPHRGDGVLTQLVNPDGPEASAEITRLRGEVERLREENALMLENLKVENKRSDKAEAALEPLWDTIRFYADEARWTMNSAGITPALDDKGHRARSALGDG